MRQVILLILFTLFAFSNVCYAYRAYKFYISNSTDKKITIIVSCRSLKRYAIKYLDYQDKEQTIKIYGPCRNRQLIPGETIELKVGRGTYSICILYRKDATQPGDLEYLYITNADNFEPEKKYYFIGTDIAPDHPMYANNPMRGYLTAPAKPAKEIAPGEI